MPEPLNRVLEPVSVLHLDMMDDDDLTRRAFVRHGSVGTMEDPGVIGPVVWNMHQQRLQHGKISTPLVFRNTKLFSFERR